VFLGDRRCARIARNDIFKRNSFRDRAVMRIPATIACHHLRCKARGELVRKTHSIDYLPEGSRDKTLLAEQRLKRSTREPSEPLTIPRVMKLKKLEVPASINSAWFWRRL
jgi:hypothetical protein